MWEKECVDKGIIRFGFGSAKPERFGLCRSGRWDDLTASFVAAGRTKGTATRFTNETRLFFEDDGSTLWITFVGERLYWGFLKGNSAEAHADGDGVWRAIVNGWRSADVKGEELTKEQLSGALTQLAAYRGTSCSVDVADYVTRRINGQKTENVERASAALSEMKAATLDLMKDLGPGDFEILIDLIFTASGWRRLGTLGKTQKGLDIDMRLPTTGERALVQVKSRTTSAELAEYVGKLDQLGPYDRMFYVYHSGEAETDDERVIVINAEKLAELVLNSGLVNWLIDKVS